MHKIRIKTILFDMDGVVIDSEKLHLRAMGLTLEKHNIPYTQSFLNEYVGRSDESFFHYVYENMSSKTGMGVLIEEKNTFFEDLLKELQYVEGFKEFIEFVNEEGIQSGLVTSSSLFTVRKVNELLNLSPYFEVTITEEDTLLHKPNPEPYLLALEKLGANKTETLIIEDSINGIKSGKASGCVVAGLTTSFGTETLMKAGADFAVDSFTKLQSRL